MFKFCYLPLCVYYSLGLRTFDWAYSNPIKPTKGKQRQKNNIIFSSHIHALSFQNADLTHSFSLTLSFFIMALQVYFLLRLQSYIIIWTTELILSRLCRSIYQNTTYSLLLIKKVKTKAIKNSKFWLVIESTTIPYQFLLVCCVLILLAWSSLFYSHFTLIIFTMVQSWFFFNWLDFWTFNWNRVDQNLVDDTIRENRLQRLLT